MVSNYDICQDNARSQLPLFHPNEVIIYYNVFSTIATA